MSLFLFIRRLFEHVLSVAEKTSESCVCIIVILYVLGIQNFTINGLAALSIWHNHIKEYKL